MEKRELGLTTAQAVAAAVAASRPSPLQPGEFTVRDFEESYGCAYQTAIRKCHDLAKRGLLASREVGPRGRLAFRWIGEDDDKWPDPPIDDEIPY